MKYKFRRTNEQKYKKYMLNSIILALAAVIIALASRSFFNKEDAQTVQGELLQNTNSYYTANENSSQETPKSASTPIPRVTVKPSAAPTASPKPTATPAPQDTFLITLYEGKISVFKNDEKTPETTLSTPIEWLTDEDIALLNEGIKLNSMSEVRAFLEDYE